jgi:hypothetical protein
MTICVNIANKILPVLAASNTRGSNKTTDSSKTISNKIDSKPTEGKNTIIKTADTNLLLATSTRINKMRDNVTTRIEQDSNMKSRAGIKAEAVMVEGSLKGTLKNFLITFLGSDEKLSRRISKIENTLKHNLGNSRVKRNTSRILSSPNRNKILSSSIKLLMSNGWR